MSLASPNLDDRDWRDLMQAARDRIRATCPDWTDLSPSDPGVVLLDVFAYLTEILIYRVNRIPEKAWVEFLRLLGLCLEPATAATAELTFAFADGTAPRAATIPARTAVTNQAGTVTFHTIADVQLDERTPSATVLAVHGEFVTVVRTADGQPGSRIRLPRPGVAAGPADLDLTVLVELASGSTERADVSVDGRGFARWDEIESFGLATPGDRVFVADRHAGTLQFAPAADVDGSPGAALAALPARGAQIRVEYLRGGGPDGNVRAGELTRLTVPIDGIEVRQPERALGGRAAEDLERALRRGPLELRRPFRAVTARDYEIVAESLPEVDRARAFTQCDLWQHAMPGTVEIAVVAADAGAFPAHVLARVAAELDARRPLGTRCVVRDAGRKEVAVHAGVTVHRAADPELVQRRVLERIERLLDARTRAAGGGEWPFGQSLHVSRIYEACLAEPGVVSVDSPELRVVQAPGTTLTAVAADPQPGVFYCADGGRVFRSVDGGDGFELALDATGEDAAATVVRLGVSAFRAGCVAAIASAGDASVVYASFDCGQSWPVRLPIGHRVYDLAWTEDESQPMLLLATQLGLYRTPLRAGGIGASSIDPVLGAPQTRIYSVAVSATPSARFAVAIGTRNEKVHLSRRNAAGDSFDTLDSDQLDVRLLRFQELDGHTHLWAGLAVAGRQSTTGDGAARWALGIGGGAPGNREVLSTGWSGQPFGSCTGLAFVGVGRRTALASTSGGRVVALDTKAATPRWAPVPEDVGIGYVQEGEHAGQKPELCGLAAQPRTGAEPADRVLVAGDAGLYRADLRSASAAPPAGGPDARFARLGERRDIVTIPPTWLFRSGPHDIRVHREGEP
ncbi:MAG: baseplate J/gp47 family protein [Planctomycetes bacterium]|nr:baseplate J/gp47 family protein [Planctomycetota bacterium]